MSYKKRLLWMEASSLLTTIILYFTVDLTVRLTDHYQDTFGYTLGYLLMLVVAMAVQIISNFPSVTLFWLVKYPNALIVALLASVEGFLISYLATPMTVSVFGFWTWRISTFLSVLAGYLLIDTTIQSKQSIKNKSILTGVVLLVTAFMLALYLKG